MDSTVTERAETLAEMMTERLGIKRGETPGDKLRIGGRLLPRRVRRAAEYVAETADRVAVPRFAGLVDEAQFAKAERVLRKHLETVDPNYRRKGVVLGVLGWLAFNFLVIAGLVIWYLWETGRI